jgi:tetraacyldisaccharide 4'-kinase
MASSLADVADWTWYDDGGAARLVRGALWPLSTLFGALVARRNAAFDRAAPAPMPIPALSIGNLTVGGTGKTPVASWFAARLVEKGARPALLLRGYGDDEWRVHQLLTPDVPVLIGPERLAGMRRAAAQACDCVVLDDAFQHRRAPRSSDVVLVSADRWVGRVQLLPGGPFREPLRAVQRATAVVVTVKAATAAQVGAVCSAISRVAPLVPMAVVRLMPDALHAATATEGVAVRSLASLAGARIVLVSAIAHPAALEQQLRDQGALIVHHQRFPDHHAYDAMDVSGVFRLLHGAALAVCTLKDAVKLAPLWPREAAPLWYVSQTLVVERGAEVLERECDRVLAAR